MKESNVNFITPFLWAAFHGQIPIMHWLLTEGGANLAEQTTGGANAFEVAVRGGHVPVMQCAGAAGS
jgi:ankyrin repeat protein